MRDPRDTLRTYALSRAPKLLTLLDRDPHSPTYGCFDRAYWHLKIKDFPSGMAQEFAWPLALLFAHAHADNPFHRSPVLAEWLVGAIRFARTSAHADGSCDDYFPFERASGATAFSLLALMETAELIGHDDAETRDFFERRANWLSGYHEAGRLSNHEALIALCLLRVGELTDNRERWVRLAEARLDRLLSWQDPEGWFDEYGGADLGYLSLTIALLAEYERKTGKAELRSPILSALEFVAAFAPPDGVFGGPIFSRNTSNYFPHGFELVGDWAPQALHLNDLVYGALATGRTPSYDDDHIVAHHMWSYLLALDAWIEDRPQPTATAEGRRWFPSAGLLAERDKATTLFVSTRKGGAYRFYVGDGLAAADTQVSLRLANGRVARADMTPNAKSEIVDDDEIVISGALGWAKQTRMTPVRLVVLRIFMLVAGRFAPNFTRRLLQRLLITGRDPAPFAFRRRFRRMSDGWEVDDQFSAMQGWQDVTAIGIGAFQSSTHVVMSRVFDVTQLLGAWRDLGVQLTKVRQASTPLTVSRRLQSEELPNETDHSNSLL